MLMQVLHVHHTHKPIDKTCCVAESSSTAYIIHRPVSYSDETRYFLKDQKDKDQKQ